MFQKLYTIGILLTSPLSVEAEAKSVVRAVVRDKGSIQTSPRKSVIRKVSKKLTDETLAAAEEAASCGGSVPASCQVHIDWAQTNGQFTQHAPVWYAGFPSLFNKSFGTATNDEMRHIFYCDRIWSTACNDVGLTPLCDASGQPMSCHAAIDPNLKCGATVPTACAQHINWAFATGQHRAADAPVWYPSLPAITGGRSYGSASSDEMRHVFYCDEIWKDVCNDNGLTPLCDAHGQPRSCDVEPPSAPAPAPPPDDVDCRVTVYEHWPEGVAAWSLADPALDAAAKAWGGEFPTGATKVLIGTGDHPLATLSNLTSSVKVQGACCKAYGFTSADCSGKQGTAIAATTQLLQGNGLPAGVVTPATGIAAVWGCNDCAQCVRVEQTCP